MAVQIRGGDIVFSDGSTQSKGISTDFGGVGTYSTLIYAGNADQGLGALVAGSALRYAYSPNIASSTLFPSTIQFSGLVGGRQRGNNATYDGGGAALAGTWRKMSNGPAYGSVGDGYGNTLYQWFVHLWVRVS
jgi:hypothetical protein